MGEITELQERLTGSRRFREGSAWVIPLHSTVSPADQRRVSPGRHALAACAGRRHAQHALSLSPGPRSQPAAPTAHQPCSFCPALPSLPLRPLRCRPPACARWCWPPTSRRRASQSRTLCTWWTQARGCAVLHDVLHAVPAVHPSHASTSESSLVHSPISAGKLKERRYDAARGMSLLVEDWVSAASAKQRRGRAGRVRPGVCYGLYSRARFEHRMRRYQARLEEWVAGHGWGGGLPGGRAGVQLSTRLLNSCSSAGAGDGARATGGAGPADPPAAPGQGGRLPGARAAGETLGACVPR